MLLGDVAYRKIWKAWEWLVRSPQEVERMWMSGPDRLRVTAFWAVAARVSDRPDCLLIDEACRAQLGLVSDAFGLERPQPGPQWPKAAAPGVTRFVLAPEGNAVEVELAMRETGEIVAWTFELPRGEPIEPVRLAKVSVEIHFTPQVAREAGRGLPMTVKIRSEVRNDRAKVERAATFADLEGLAWLADRVAERLLIYRPPAERAKFVRPEPAANPPKFVGLDLAGAAPRIVSEDGPVASRVRLFASEVRLPEGATEWFIGHEARRTGPWNEDWPLLSPHHAFPPDGRATPPAVARAMGEIIKALVNEIGPDPRAQIALAIPDTLDELDQSRLRSATPVAVGRLWLPWRSVTAAMGWQATPGYAAEQVEEGDVLFVVDAEAPMLTATYLKARYDSRLDGDAARGIYWERKSTFAVPAAADLTYGGLLAETCELALQPFLRTNDQGIVPFSEQKAEA